MKDSLRILNSKEIKNITGLLEKQWGVKKKFDYAYLLSTRNNIYLASRDFDKIDDKKLRIEIIGVYFGELSENNIRLSIEGSQMIGPLAEKNVVEVDKDQMKSWLKGNDLENLDGLKDANAKSINEDCFVILKCEDDFIGCGRYKRDDKKILCYVPKNRRIMSRD